MKFGVREICDVVLKAKAKQTVGNKTFFKNEPVIYFDTLKTSSLEGAATTVYAQGGAGNSRLVAWEGERTVTFKMTDALISPEGFMILSGAGLVEASDSNKIRQHVVETVPKGNDVHVVSTSGSETINISLEKTPYVGDGTEAYAYVFFVADGEIISEPYLAYTVYPGYFETSDETKQAGKTYYTKSGNTYSQLTGDFVGGTTYYEFNGAGLTVAKKGTDYTIDHDKFASEAEKYDAVLVDYYTEVATGAKQIDITPDKFGGNYYLEASTLWRKENGSDVAAEFIIPNCKIQSNFTFTMASSGDPSTFDFTMDAFPDYTRFDRSKKVLAAIQIIDDDAAANAEGRTSTWQA